MDAVTSKQQVNQKTKSPILKVLRCAGTTPFEEGLALCRKEKLALASNMGIGKALSSHDIYLAIKMAIPCWTGTIAAYIEPDRPFKDAAQKITSLGNNHFLIYEDEKTRKCWFFPVPEEHLDKRNAVLIAEKNYSVDVEYVNRIVWPVKVGVVEGFPSASGWYPGDAVYDVPCIGGIRENPRYLLRDKARVGPIATDHGRFPNAERRIIHFDKSIASSLGLIVDAP